MIHIALFFLAITYTATAFSMDAQFTITGTMQHAPTLLNRIGIGAPQPESWEFSIHGEILKEFQTLKDVADEHPYQAIPLTQLCCTFPIFKNLCALACSTDKLVDVNTFITSKKSAHQHIEAADYLGASNVVMEKLLSSHCVQKELENLLPTVDLDAEMDAQPLLAKSLIKTIQKTKSEEFKERYHSAFYNCLYSSSSWRSTDEQFPASSEARFESTAHHVGRIAVITGKGQQQISAIIKKWHTSISYKIYNSIFTKEKLDNFYTQYTEPTHFKPRKLCKVDESVKQYNNIYVPDSGSFAIILTLNARTHMPFAAHILQYALAYGERLISIADEINIDDTSGNINFSISKKHNFELVDLKALNLLRDHHIKLGAVLDN